MLATVIVRDVNTLVNAVVPPLPAVPDTTRNALLSCVVDLVQPVGAEVCTNNIAVPLGKYAQAPVITPGLATSSADTGVAVPMPT